MKRRPRRKNIALGSRFGKLTVICEAEQRVSGAYAYQCRCDCGSLVVAATKHLINGKKSCGCLNAEVTRRRSTVHGHSARGNHTPEFRSWRNMIARCTYPSSNRYHRYGGRGIKVCERWREFANFFADMGKRPPQTSLDRIDNDGDYEPTNCRWAHTFEQSINTRRTVRATLNGETLSLMEWSKRLGESPKNLRYGLQHHPPEVVIGRLIRRNESKL